MSRPVTWHDDPAHFRRPSRRGFMQVGAVAGLGLTLDGFFRSQARAESTAPLKGGKKPAAEAIIHIYLPGGMAHQETFDPKPNAPLEYRGDMSPINTAIPGVQFNETLERTAKVADKLVVCRSMTHGEADHGRGTHNMFTGWRPSPAITYPSMGSVVSHELGVRNSLPPYVCVPSQPTNFAASGFLSSSYAPFSLGSDPGNAGFTVRDLNLPNGIDEGRFTTRRSMLDAVNEHFRKREKSDNLDAMDTFYQRAYSLISAPKAREAFNIAAEPDALRDKYGRNTAGQRMLMARRLVESGVRFVSLTYGGWDMHANITASIKKQVPEFDKAFAALITDLDQRGMLASTLVMVSSEFGRTPKINKDAGRDHWPKVFSVVLAGGGLKRGVVYGASDPTATEPESDPLTVEDLAYTVYHQLGVDPDKKLMSPGSRPVMIVDEGKLRREIVA